MPAFADITINDGQGTPVAHTFKPTEITGDGVAIYHDRSSGIAIGYNRVALSMKMPSAAGAGMASEAKNRVIRKKITIDCPTMESTSAATGTGITPAPTVAYVDRVVVEFLSPERNTLQNRKDIHAYAKNLLAHATVTSLIQDNEAVY